MSRDELYFLEEEVEECVDTHITADINESVCGRCSECGAVFSSSPDDIQTCQCDNYLEYDDGKPLDFNDT